MKPAKLVHAWGPVAFWMGLIFYLSSQSTLPTFPAIVPDTVAKKGGHFIEYAILASLCWRALRLTVNNRYPAWIAFIVTVLYASSDEFHQLFIPGRNGRLTDVMIDSLGAVFGLAAVYIWQEWQPAGDHEVA